MRTSFMILAIVFATAPFISAQSKTPSVTVPTFANSECPIMGKRASSVLFVDTQKGRIYLCCTPCIKKVLADPERAHKAAFPVIKKVDNKVCPLTGKPIVEGSSTVVLQGHQINVCCEDCVKKASDNAQVVLALAIDPKVKDVGNTLCPISGTAVGANAFCIIDGSLVRLSSPKVVDDVRKDPAAALEKARKQAEGRQDAR